MASPKPSSGAGGVIEKRQGSERDTMARKTEAPIHDVRQLVVGLLKIGAEDNVDQLFDLIIHEAPRLVGAKECSIFWKDGPWRNAWREGTAGAGSDERFYRRATYKEKKDRVGAEYYLPGEGLTGWVALHGRTLNIKNVADKDELRAISADLKWSDKYRGYKSSQERDKQSAFLAVPVEVEAEVVGVIRIAKTLESHRFFSEDDQHLLEAFAANVSHIIRKAEERGLRDFWDRLYLSGADLAPNRFADYLQEIVDEIPRYLVARGCSIFLTEHDVRSRKKLLRLRASTKGAPICSKVGVATYQFGEGLTGWVAKSCKPLRLKNIDDPTERRQHGSDLNFKGKHEEYLERYPSFLAAPIHRDEEVLGVIRVVQDANGKFFSAADERFVEQFCRHLAVLLQNVELVEGAASESSTPLEELHDSRDALNMVVEDIGASLNRISRDVHHLSGKHGPVTLDNKPPDPRRVFIGIPFSSSAQNVFDFGIKPAIDDLELICWKADNFRTVKLIVEKVFEGVQTSSIGIIDVSEWNPNVLFELGALYWADRPVILLKREDAEIPADLAGIEYVSYGKFDDLCKDLKEALIPLMAELHQDF